MAGSFGLLRVGHVLASTALLALVACSGGGGSDNKPAPGPGGGGLPDPTPDPGPSKSILLTDILSDTGTLSIFNGECIGFTIEAKNMVFAADTFQAELDFVDGTYALLAPDMYEIINPTHVVVGDPCLFFGPGFNPGPVDLLVTDGIDVVGIEGAIDVGAQTPVSDLGAASLSGSSSALLTNMRANTIYRAGDVDYYLADTAPQVVGWLMQPMGTSELVPLTAVIDSSVLSTTWAGGHYMALSDLTGYTVTNTLASVEDVSLRGGTGYEYRAHAYSFDSALDVQTLHGANTVAELTVLNEITASGVYRGDLFADTNGVPFTNDYDPMGGASPPETGTYPNATCVSQVSAATTEPGETLPIYAAGADAIYTLRVPAGAEVFVGGVSDGVDGFGAGGDLALYVVNDSDTIPTDAAFGCAAGADYFPGMLTDSMRIQNTTGSEQVYKLFVDQYTGEVDLPTYLLWVQFF